MIVAIGAVFGWLLMISSWSHRRRALPRTVTRWGLLSAALFFVGAVLFGTSLLIWSTPIGPQVFLVAGVVPGSLGWLGLWVWPLLLARRVLHSSSRSGGEG